VSSYDKSVSVNITGNIQGDHIDLVLFYRFTKEEIKDNEDDDDLKGVKSFTVFYSGTVTGSKMKGTGSGRTDKKKLGKLGTWSASRR